MISLNDPSDKVFVGAFAHSLYIMILLDPQDTEAWKYYLRFKQSSTQNSGPGSLLMELLHKKCVGRIMKYHCTPALVKNMFQENLLCMISLNDPSDRVYYLVR